ncbi:MAG TPA: histidine kinase [Myxococcales bacterium]|jgi:hypothetical protein
MPPFWVVALAWLGVVVFVMVQQETVGLATGERSPFWPLLGYHLTSCGLWALFTPAIWEITRRFSFQHKLRDVCVHIAANFFLIAVESAAVDIILHGSVILAPGIPQRMLRLTLIDSFSYAGVMAVGLLLLSRARVERLELSLAEVRLEALEAQLRPHFLFNALNTVSSLVRAGDGNGAVRAVAALGDVLRGSLRRTGNEVALHEELSLAERYLDLERTRFGEKLRYRVTAEAEVAQAQVPPLLLQPLVENALAHGRGKDGSAEVEIHVERSGKDLRIEVRDAGSGPSAGKPDGIGLANTRARLTHLYGERGRLEVLARAGGGAVTMVSLPLRELAT